MTILAALAGQGPSNFAKGIRKWIRERAKQDISTLEANGNFAAAGVMRKKYDISDDEELPPPKRKRRRGGPGPKDPDATLPKRESTSKHRIKNR